MDFTGKWQSEAGIEFELAGPFGGDDYRITWEQEGDENSELIPIYKSNSSHALLAGSRLFGRCDINILADDRIEIGSIPFVRTRNDA